jgi:co-chaperonin GroES (HSP10)
MKAQVVEFKALNPSGISPTEYKALIRPKQLGEKTPGGIIIPDETKDRDQFAQMEGDLVAVSPLAFSYDGWAGHEHMKPKPGDKVLFAKFSGAKVTGRDGVEYRLVNDKDIAAVLS